MGIRLSAPGDGVGALAPAGSGLAEAEIVSSIAIKSPDAKSDRTALWIKAARAGCICPMAEWFRPGID